MIESLKKVYALLPKGDVKKLIILFIMMIVASFLTLLGIGTIPVFVAVVLDAERVLATPVVGPFLEMIDIQTPQRLVVFSAGILIVVYFFKNMYMLFYDYIMSKFMLNRKLMLQNRLFDAYMQSPYTWFIGRKSSELLRNVNNEVSRILDGTLRPLMLISLHSVMAVVIITALIIVEPLITGVGILFFGGFSWLFLKLTRSKIEFYGSESLHHRNWMNFMVLQGLGGFKDARVLNRERHFVKGFNKHADKHRHYDLWHSVINSAPLYVIELIALTGILFIAIVMVLQFRELTSIVTVLAMFGAATVKIKPSITTIIANMNALRYNVFSVDAAYRDILKLEGVKTKQIHNEVGKGLLELRDTIELRDVHFAYPATKHPAVKNISLTIPKNSAVAFVGESGSGKTTLVDVILGLLEPQKGEVLVDGINILPNLPGWQKNIGYIPQFIYLTDDTIRRNICFGIPDEEVDEEQLGKVIDIAQLATLIHSLEKGVDTIIGERGVRLSGGQRQRIGIARALYHNPQVLVMDEATSALDNITEKFVVEAFNRLKGEKTIIMVAHRLTTVQNCDTIYMMKNAEIINSGTYDELLLTSAEFREMSLVDGNF